MGCSSSKSVVDSTMPEEQVVADSPDVSSPSSPQPEQPTPLVEAEKSTPEVKPIKFTFEELLERISANDPKTKQIVISDESPSTTEVIQLCTAVSSNTHINQLKLINVTIPVEAFDSLSQIFGAAGLDEVIFSNTNLGNEGARVILKETRVTSLSSVSLDGNEITDDIVDDICSTIKESPVLYRLNLSNNCLSSEGLLKIHEACKSNAALEQVIVTGNKESMEFAVEGETNLVF
ncbi:hypothetical protein P9112_014096 [Eukaryota sp. TZLM1-RC]